MLSNTVGRIVEFGIRFIFSRGRALSACQGGLICLALLARLTQDGKSCLAIGMATANFPAEVSWLAFLRIFPADFSRDSG